MLLVSHRPLGYGGVGATRWGYMMDALRELGWEIETVSPPPNPTADEMSSDPRVARLSALRARIMHRVGQVIRPAAASDMSPAQVALVAERTAIVQLNENRLLAA